MSIADAVAGALDGAAPERVAVIGLGTRDRADDAFGLAVAERLDEAAGRRVFSEEKRAVENIVIDLVEREDGPLVFFVDAADFGEPPGTLKLFGPDAVQQFSPPFSTHKVPLPFLMEHINAGGGSAFLVAVQPGSLALFGEMTAEILTAVETVCSVFSAILKPADRQ
ncbi:hydrogenase maturation protease [bacterium]|nr:hydrogenase maturation protease [bacterium]